MESKAPRRPSSKKERIEIGNLAIFEILGHDFYEGLSKCIFTI